jgi:short-subunit dehydrogenase
VARRQDKLDGVAAAVGGPSRASTLALDLTEERAPARVLETIERDRGALHMLVNNAGAAWRGRFADTGWANVERHMKLNFEAPVRLTEALLPLLRRTAAGSADSADGRRVCVVNIASTAGRVSRPRSAAYSASKFALIGWSDGLYAEELEHGVHVGLVLPGFVKTEGFPARELLASAVTRRIVTTPDVVAEAVLEAGLGGKAERYVPRYYWIPAALRILVPGLVRRAVARGGLATATKGDD